MTETLAQEAERVVGELLAATEPIDVEVCNATLERVLADTKNADGLSVDDRRTVKAAVREGRAYWRGVREWQQHADMRTKIAAADAAAAGDAVVSPATVATSAGVVP